MHNEELKNDPELGLRVHLYLKEMGVETPGVNCNMETKSGRSRKT